MTRRMLPVYKGLIIAIIVDIYRGIYHCTGSDKGKRHHTQFYIRCVYAADPYHDRVFPDYLAVLYAAEMRGDKIRAMGIAVVLVIISYYHDTKAPLLTKWDFSLPKI